MKAQSLASIPVAKIIIIGVLTSLFLGIALWMVIPAPPIGFYWDDNWYVLMAEWLTPDSNYRKFAWNMLWVTSYPPLFPLFISWSGANLADQQNAFIMNAFFLTVGTGAAMLWFAREKFSTITMAIAGTLVVFNPVSLAYISILYSEFLYIFLSMSALVLAFFERDWKWNANWLVIGLIVGLSVATRTAGWSLAAGFLVHLVLNRKLPPALAFIAGLGMSILVIPFLMVGLPPSSVNYLDRIVSNIDNLGWDFLTQQIKGLAAGWFMLWGWAIGAWLAAVMVLPGLFIRLKANRVDAWYVMMYFGMLLLWPWPGHMSRFLWPLMPCFLVSMHSSLELFKHSKHRSVIASVLMGLILVTSIPDGIGRSMERLLDPPAGELFQFSRMHEWARSSTTAEGIMTLRERQQILKDLQRVDEAVNTTACVYSEMSGLVAVQTRQVSYASRWSSLDDVDQINARCEYYYMLPQQVSGTTIDEVNRFSESHEELFRSFSPGDSEGKLPLGVFLRFRPSTAK